MTECSVPLPNASRCVAEIILVGMETEMGMVTGMVTGMEMEMEAVVHSNGPWYPFQHRPAILRVRIRM